MKNITVNFTDAYGLTHENAVFEVSYASKNVSKVETIGSSGQSQESVSVNFQFKYWHSQEAKDSGCQAIALMDKNGQATFGAYPSTEIEVSSLEDFCFKQLVNVVLKGIDANVVVVV